MLEYRATKVPEYVATGVSEYRATKVPDYIGTGAFEDRETRVSEYAATRAFRCQCIRRPGHASIQVPRLSPPILEEGSNQEECPAMRTIACLNWKGGSGKSTTALALAVGIARHFPSANASCWSTATRKPTPP